MFNLYSFLNTFYLLNFINHSEEEAVEEVVEESTAPSTPTQFNQVNISIIYY
jgi:hypothetical protein